MKISKARYHVFMSLSSRMSDEARPFKKPSRLLGSNETRWMEKFPFALNLWKDVPTIHLQMRDEDILNR